MTLYQDSRSTKQHLSRRHEEMLFKESGNSPEVVAERGVRTLRRGRELPEGFSWRQKRRGAGILFTIHRPNGETSWSFRPDAPDSEKPGRKYEQPCKAYGGPGNVLDVHPSLRHLIDDMSAPVMFVEGIKKADAITSAARAAGIKVLVVAITGVWNWMADGEPIPDMLDIPVKGRRTIVCFDSDMLRNANVQEAAGRLAEHFISRGALTWVTYLHDNPDGSKVGADDFFVAGGTFSELKMLMRRYDPDDFVVVRLSRDERLQLALEDLERRFWESEWKGMGGHSARDVALKLIEAARRHGKIVDDGVRVKKAQGPLAIEAKVSSRTLWKAINRLEEWGFLYRDNEDRKEDKTGAFVLRASVRHYGGDRRPDDQATQALQTFHRGDLHLRAPRLRWSRPKFTPKRGVVEETRRVRQGVKLESRDRIVRLGKVRGAILDMLDVAGGRATLQGIAEALHRKRARDIRRRNLPMLEEAGILTVEDDVVTLADNWLKALEVQRKLGKEVEADELAAVRHRLKSRAFHNRHKVKVDEAPVEDEMRAHRDGYAERRRRAIEEAIARLFQERPEYRGRRPGQVTWAIACYIGPEFPLSQDGYPKDAEVEAILSGAAA
jgi:Domain of unknown function (DUF3854)